MKKIVLITGSTDGIGLETAKLMLSLGHKVLLHGRNEAKLAQVKQQLSPLAEIESYIADLSDLAQVNIFAEKVSQDHPQLDILINNAGVYNVSEMVSSDGLDVRFAVNVLAPYLLTNKLIKNLGITGRVINLSSAAQAQIRPSELTQPSALADSRVYAKSKLALTMWSRHLALKLGQNGPAIIAVNPASMLASKMVKEAYGIIGGDLTIGAKVLVKAALSAEFSAASGLYFDNDIGEFTSPHVDVADENKIADLVRVIENTNARALSSKESNETKNM
jgi:NAD(P)-dependent dehydrogenase (short-subunit alcohol dehydrogenase family)